MLLRSGFRFTAFFVDNSSADDVILMVKCHFSISTTCILRAAVLVFITSIQSFSFSMSPVSISSSRLLTKKMSLF